MPGRLEKYDDFKRVVENNRTGGVKPMKPADPDRPRSLRRRFDGDNVRIALNKARETGAVCYVFYRRKRDGAIVYRLKRIPKKRLYVNHSPKMYVEVIDFKTNRRETLLLSRIKAVKILRQGRRNDEKD